MANLNINLTESRRPRYTIDGDKNRVIEFDPSDLGVLIRIEKVDTTITEAVEAFSKEQDEADFTKDETIYEMAKKLKELDILIRGQLDYLFDTNFSEVCIPHGTTLDPINGDFRFVYLIDVFSDVYTDGLNTALEKRNNKIKQHTKKYVNKVK